MLWKQIAQILMNDSIVYVAGINDYKLKYMNASAKELFGIPSDDESYLEQKCYKLFFDQDTPCDFCKNPILNKENFYRWDSYNQKFDEHFYHRSKMISIEGEDYHFEIADIFTDRIKRQLEIEHQLETQQTLIKCIQTLSDKYDANHAINSLLQIVGHYYDCDRTYLFEINWMMEILSNTYEWVNNGVSREIDNLQDIPVSVIKHWLYIFREKGAFYISNVDENVDQDTREYELLQMQNIQSLVAAPLFKEGIITGFIGVDNPRKNFEDFTLLTSVTHVIQNDLEKRRVTQKLEKLSYEDPLTGLYNRNKYNYTIEDLKTAPPGQLGIVYIDLNGLKTVNDTYGHEEGDKLLRSAASIIRSLFRNDNYRIGGDEFVIILPHIPEQVFYDRIDRLRKHFEKENVLASIGFNWRDKNVNIIEQVRMADINMYAEKEAFYKEQDAALKG